MKNVIFGLLGLALLIGGCGCNKSVPIDEIEEPVAYVGRPPSTLASLVAPLVPEPVSSWGNEELMIVDAATGETWQLTSNGEDDFQPTWSPSGTHLLYLSHVAPFFRSRKLTKLYVYDLKEGSSRHVDLSWALDSGPAAPRRSFGDLSRWLECAAWSPVDSTKVAVGVQVGRPTVEKPTGSEKRIVLLDLEEKTGRLLVNYGGFGCERLFWAPSGELIGLIGGAISFHYLHVEDKKKGSLSEMNTSREQRVNYVPLDWRGDDKGDVLLVRMFKSRRDSFRVSEYNFEKERWSKELGMFSNSIKVGGYISDGGEEGTGRVVDLVLIDDPRQTPRSDLWRYRRPERTFERLTDDRMPKEDVTSYRGKREEERNHP